MSKKYSERHHEVMQSLWPEVPSKNARLRANRIIRRAQRKLRNDRYDPDHVDLMLLYADMIDDGDFDSETPLTINQSVDLLIKAWLEEESQQ